MDGHTLKGFTLIELIVVLTIASILLSIGIPSFYELSRRSQSDTQIENIRQLLLEARTKAIVNSHTVTICPSTDHKSCSLNWQNSLMAFVDTNRNQLVDGNEAILKIQSLKSNYTLTWKAFGNKSYLTYSAMGTINHNNGTLTLCPNDKKSHYGRRLIINKGGRVRKGQDKGSIGAIQTANGSGLMC